MFSLLRCKYLWSGQALSDKNFAILKQVRMLKDLVKKPAIVFGDWNMSPDGDHLAYTEQSGLAMQVRVVSLTEFEPAFPALRAATASGQTLLEADAVLNDTPATVGTASPIWAPDGSLSVGAFQTRAPGDGELRTASSGGDTTATAGFALPLAWSSDGAHLAIRAFEGSGPGRSTAETAAIVGPSGESRTVDGSHILVLGWWNAAR